MTGDDAWLERQYWADVIADLSEETVEQRATDSRLVRSQNHAYLDQSYGSHERQKLDLFLPSGVDGPCPMFVYVHGGYWKRGTKDDCAFLATEWLKRGVAVAVLGYRLAPDVTLPEIVSDVRDAFALLANLTPSLGVDTSKIVVACHSAGAHLVSMEITSSNELRPCAAVLTSGVFDPRPLKSTSVGPFLANSLPLSFEQLSPFGRPPPATHCIIAWGGDETDVFKRQSETLAQYWSHWGFAAETMEIADAHHFTIMDCLRADDQGPLVSAIFRQLDR